MFHPVLRVGCRYLSLLYYINRREPISGFKTGFKNTKEGGVGVGSGVNLPEQSQFVISLI